MIDTLAAERRGLNMWAELERARMICTLTLRRAVDRTVEQKGFWS
jgi:hypothetical protein